MASNLGTAPLVNAMLGTTAVYRAYLGPIQVWQREAVATISASTAQVVLPGSYFSAGDWANPLVRKRLVITNGAHVWSYTQGVPALDLGTGRQGELHVDIHSGAYVLGHAGARNSGVGGTAIKVRQNQCWINFGGGIYGGGGGGGLGGQGGTGVWFSGRTVQEGPLYTPFPNRTVWELSPSYGALYWGSAHLGNIPPSSTSYSTGGWTYYRHLLEKENTSFGSPYGDYSIYRITTVYDVPNYTSGGPGGFGGKGTGYNSSLVNEGEAGGNGSAGGTNAGVGGKGGGATGWGAQGGTGQPGATGNYAGGTAGAAGGLGGLYIDGIANVNALTNTGSGLVLGRVA